MKDSVKMTMYHLCVGLSVVAGKQANFKTRLKDEQAEPHSSVGSIADLRTDGHWFNPRLRQYSFRGLMIVIATGFIPLSPLSVVSTMVMWEISQWLGKNIVWSTG